MLYWNSHPVHNSKNDVGVVEQMGEVYGLHVQEEDKQGNRREFGNHYGRNGRPIPRKDMQTSEYDQRNHKGKQDEFHAVLLKQGVDNQKQCQDKKLFIQDRKHISDEQGEVYIPRDSCHLVNMLDISSQRRRNRQHEFRISDEHRRADKINDVHLHERTAEILSFHIERLVQVSAQGIQERRA